ncbi:hypothetical protein ACA910_009301 [Epithemia clementina (nom. ined.)]
MALHKWEGYVIEPNGNKVLIDDSSSHSGQRFPYVGGVYDKPEGHQLVGYNIELCTRLDDANLWQCQGTYVNFYSCWGVLSFLGFYQDTSGIGHFVITGESGDFLGAMGAIYEEFDSKTGYTTRKISVF